MQCACLGGAGFCFLFPLHAVSCLFPCCFMQVSVTEAEQKALLSNMSNDPTQQKPVRSGHSRPRCQGKLPLFHSLPQNTLIAGRPKSGVGGELIQRDLVQGLLFAKRENKPKPMKIGFLSPNILYRNTAKSTPDLHMLHLPELLLCALATISVLLS